MFALLVFLFSVVFILKSLLHFMYKFFLESKMDICYYFEVSF